MLKISRLADYATIIMTCLAEAPEGPLSASAIAEKTRIASPTVSKILKLMNEAELVTSLRGSNGGYLLARSARHINMAEIIAAIDGKPAMTQCSLGSHACHRNHYCNVRGHWQLISRAILNVLESISVADLNQPYLNAEMLQLLTRVKPHSNRAAGDVHS